MSTFSETRRAAMKRAAQNRLRHGNRPTPSNGANEWRLMASTERDGVTWELYDCKPQWENKTHIDFGGEWSSHKLIAMPGRRGKANFWFGYNYAEGRLTENADASTLLEAEPEVYAWTLATIDPDTYGGLA